MSVVNQLLFYVWRRNRRDTAGRHQRLRFGQQFKRFLDLGIALDSDLETLLQPEGGSVDFLLDTSFYEIDVVLDVFIAEFQFSTSQEFFEVLENRVSDLKLRDGFRGFCCRRRDFLIFEGELKIACRRHLS